jgi:hypothetical protein
MGKVNITRRHELPPVETEISNDYDIDPSPVTYTVPSRSTRAKGMAQKAVKALDAQAQKAPS